MPGTRPSTGTDPSAGEPLSVWLLWRCIPPLFVCGAAGAAIPHPHSGPLLDRIDIHIEVSAVRYAELSDGRAGETSAEIRARVERARKRQRARFRESPDRYATRTCGPAISGNSAASANAATRC